MFIIAIICVLLSYTFAPWTARPRLPAVDTAKTCTGWILHHGFGNNPIENKQRALTRESQYDRYVSLWAAGYAYALIRNAYYFDLRNDFPFMFCNRQVPDSALYFYLPLEDAEFTCEGWINFYGYDHRNEISQNLHWATNRNVLMDNHISIWAAGYFRYITSDKSRNEISSAEYCHGIGHVTVKLPKEYPFMTLDGSKMSCIGFLLFPQYVDSLRCIENAMIRLPFMTFNDTRLSCQDWIQLFGYTENLKHNIQKVLQQDVDFDNFLPDSTRDYVFYLRHSIIHKRGRGDRDPLTPEIFCIHNNKPDTVKLNYYSMIIED